MKNMNGAGVFCIEMFLKKNDEVLINEIAPRVHNAGHYTIEASITSQFEQHIRAITGLPLGRTNLRSSAVMINILGERTGKANLFGLEEVLKMPNVYPHIYGKLTTKIERKMGHITVLDTNRKAALQKAIQARKLIHI
jgi:5-(carboxyamino)imidazole ribonucleotide synthase